MKGNYVTEEELRNLKNLGEIEEIEELDYSEFEDGEIKIRVVAIVTEKYGNLAAKICNKSSQITEEMRIVYHLQDSDVIKNNKDIMYYISTITMEEIAKPALNTYANPTISRISKRKNKRPKGPRKVFMLMKELRPTRYARKLPSFISSDKCQLTPWMLKWPKYAKQLLTQAYLINEAGVLHCDHKDDNIMYDRRHDILTIIDYGLSEIIWDPVKDKPRREMSQDEWKWSKKRELDIDPRMYISELRAPELMKPGLAPITMHIEAYALGLTLLSVGRDVHTMEQVKWLEKMFDPCLETRMTVKEAYESMNDIYDDSNVSKIEDLISKLSSDETSEDCEISGELECECVKIMNDKSFVSYHDLVEMHPILNELK